MTGAQFGEPFAHLEMCISRDEAQPFGVQMNLRVYVR